MRKVLQYLEFINEIKRSKLNFFKQSSISSKFTCSIEIEMETLDEEGVDQDYTEEYIEGIISKIRNSVIKELKRVENFELSEDISEFIEVLLEEVKYEIDDYDYVIDDILDSSQYEENQNKGLIVELIKQQVLTYFFSDNFEYLEGKFQDNMSNFYNKYKDYIKFELDNTLDRGIEISNRTYFNDINDLISLINDFYADFNKQDYWIFNERTGIHINIGLNEKSNYNPIKGLLFLNDTGESPFIFNNMEWRKNSKFCGSLLSKLENEYDILNRCKDEMEKGNIEKCEILLNSKLFEILTKEGYKNFGVNLVPLKNFNYIEFRHLGGEVDKDTVIDKLLYFTFVIYEMIDNKLDRKEYLKKLYKFINKKNPL